MRRKWDVAEERYFGIGIYQPKTVENLGTLWRTAYVLGADFIFVIADKFKKEKTDVYKVWSKIPLFQYQSFDHFHQSLPYSCKLVGIELDDTSQSIVQYEHPERAVYLLGSESHGLSKVIKEKCHDLVQIPGTQSLNVAVAGSIVAYDRTAKLESSSLQLKN